MADFLDVRSFPVTITLLPVSLSLVRVPRVRLIHLIHPIIRQILLPSPPFLNLTCNEIELTIFAEHDALHDFELIARRERQRHRSRSGSTSSRSSQLDVSSSATVEVSHEKWNVLQIDSHSSGIDSAGARVHDISAPLATAGISILYQSSYTSDFIFVKASRLKESMEIFAAAGFDVFSSDTSLPSPPSDFVFKQRDVLSDGASLTRLERATSAAGGSYATGPRSLPPLESVAELPIDGHAYQNSPRPVEQGRYLAHADSLLPAASSDVCLLTPDLTCIGLSNEAADVWSLKIIKLIAYPELVGPLQIASPSATDSPSTSLPPHRSTSPAAVPELSDDEDGYYSASQSEHYDRTTSPTPAFETAMSRSHSLESSSSSRRGNRLAGLHRVTAMTELARLRGDTSFPSSSASTPSPVPFFSFTRTAESSSLTAPTVLLASLFPPADRHMVMRGNELDDLELDSLSDASDTSAENGERSCPMRCLQIDLRQFGLDKHGLVNRFSRVLEGQGVNHMYSSTFKTANLLVDRAHAQKAETLLRDVDIQHYKAELAQ